MLFASQIVCDCGCVLIAGSVLTVSVAAADTAGVVQTVFETKQRY